MSETENITCEIDSSYVEESVSYSEQIVQEESQSEPVVQQETQSETVVEAEPVIQEESQLEPVVEPEQVVQEESQPEPAVEPEQVVHEEESQPEAAVEREQVVHEEESQPEAAVESEQVVQEESQPEPVVEPEQVVQEESQPEPVVEPEQVVQEESHPEPAVEPEQVVQEESHPEPVVEPEQVVQEESQPEPVVEPKSVVQEDTQKVIKIDSQLQPSVDSLPKQIIEQIDEKKKDFFFVPKLIFIVPYRDREEQRKFFSLQMKTILADYSPHEYKIIYSHQADQRGFNRGAMKNLGFIYARSLYPNDYKNITFVFNDVDIMPYTKNFLKYDTTIGKIKHFYGYTFTLGGIVSVKGADFEKMNGFPNYWSWGYEDNALQHRAKLAGIQIDRSQFYPILDKNILQLKDGITRIVNRSQFDNYVNETKYNNNIDGINTLSNISMTYHANTEFLNVTNFSTLNPEKPELNKVHDMRDGPVPFLRTGYQRRSRSYMGMFLHK